MQHIQYISFTSLLGISLLTTGCAFNEPPKVERIQIIENNTTRSILVPHNKNVKKAVAILILKMEELELKLKDAKSGNLTPNTDSDASKLLEAQQNRDIIFLKERVENCEDNLKILDSNKNDSNNKDKGAEEVIMNNDSTEYDKVIKDFTEGSLK